MRAGALMTSDSGTCQPEDDLHCAVRIMKIENSIFLLKRLGLDA